jgi:hypothetical protein
MLLEMLEDRRLMSAGGGEVFAEFNPQPDPPGHQALTVIYTNASGKMHTSHPDTNSLSGQLKAAENAARKGGDVTRVVIVPEIEPPMDG